MSTIYEDALQQQHHGVDKHARKHRWWAEHGIEVERVRFDGKHPPAPSFGDYWAEGSNYCVDTKRNVQEVAQNIGGRSHARFKRELVRAQEAGYRLVVLVENTDGYTELAHVNAWTNDHCAKCDLRDFACRPRDPRGKCPRHGTRKPIQGPRLAKAMSTMQERYGVRFEFCRPSESARRICELLGIEWRKEQQS